MPLDPALLLALIPLCAPAVAPQTLLAVARVESGFDPLAIGVNGPGGRAIAPASRDDAIRAARGLIAAGRSVDLGLGQINVRNLPALGLSVEDAFDPCRNLAASAQVLQSGYTRAAPPPGQEQAGLRAALSRYNTGDPVRGIRNGYVARVVRAAASLVPAIDPQAGLPSASPPPAPRPAWSVFGGASDDAPPSFVISPGSGDLP